MEKAVSLMLLLLLSFFCLSFGLTSELETDDSDTVSHLHLSKEVELFQLSWKLTNPTEHVQGFSVNWDDGTNNILAFDFPDSLGLLDPPECSCGQKITITVSPYNKHGEPVGGSGSMLFICQDIVTIDSLKPEEEMIDVSWSVRCPSPDLSGLMVMWHNELYGYEMACLYSGSARNTSSKDRCHGLQQNLHQCTAYEVSVQTFSVAKNYSGLVTEKKSRTLRGTPPAVTRLSSQNSTEGLTLTWERPVTACEITAYNITYSGVAKWGNRTENWGSATIGRGAAENATGVAINGLQPYTDYTVMVAAATDKGVGGRAFINTTTKEAAPTKPTNLKLLRSTASTVTLIWKEPNEMKGVLKGYEVSCYSGATRVLTETTDHPVHVIVGLAACTEYTVHVAASTAGGRSDPIAIPVKTTAGQPPPVTDFTAQDITRKSFSLTWERPATACEITAYTITYSGVAKRGPREEHKGNATIGRGAANDTTSITIESLKPNTDYTVMVTASTEAGEGQTATINAIVTGETKVATQRESNSIRPGSNSAPVLVAGPSATLIVSVIVSVLVARCCSLLHGRYA